MSQLPPLCTLILSLILLQAGAGPGVVAQAAASGATLSYTKVLKGSDPEYVKITVTPDGSATYDGRGLKDTPQPRPFKLSQATTGKLFSLAAKLNNFDSIDLESHKNVANLGLKTFAYSSGGHVSECQFNYTLNRTARELTDVFEGIASVERHVVALEYDMRFDHLGLPHELTTIQMDLNNHALADPELMTEVLEKISHDTRFLHIAQTRATDILNRISSAN
jgi:hypothetical protein